MRKSILVLSLACIFLVSGRHRKEESEHVVLDQFTLSVRSVLTFKASRKGTYVKTEGEGVFSQGYIDSFKRPNVRLSAKAPIAEGFCFPDGYRGFGAPRCTYQIMIYSFLPEYIITHPDEYNEVVNRQAARVLSREMSHGVGIEHHDDFATGLDVCVISLGHLYGWMDLRIPSCLKRTRTQNCPVSSASGIIGFP